jgi:polyhydroxybutyrate depolymerase
MLMPKFPMLVVVTVAGLALAGCTKVTTGQAGVSSSNGSPSATTAAAPCPKPVSARKGAVDDQLTFEGLNRTYRVWVPATYSGDVALPIIVNYHGTGGDPQSIDDFSSNLSAKANARNYIVVAPQGDKAGGETARWTVPGIGTTPDDVSFTNAMLDKLSSEFCIDQKRIFGETWHILNENPLGLNSLNNI